MESSSYSSFRSKAAMANTMLAQFLASSPLASLPNVLQRRPKPARAFNPHLATSRGKGGKVAHNPSGAAQIKRAAEKRARRNPVQAAARRRRRAGNRYRRQVARRARAGAGV